MNNSYLFEVKQQVIANELRVFDIEANTSEEALEIFEQNKDAIKNGSFRDCEMIKTDNSIQFKYHPSIREVEYDIEAAAYIPEATFSVTMESDNEEDILSKYTHREGVSITRLVEKESFTLEQVLEILNNLQQALNPWEYKTSKERGLMPADYRDAALCEAEKLGIKNEFIEYYETDPNFIGWKTNNN